MFFFFLDTITSSTTWWIALLICTLGSFTLYKLTWTVTLHNVDYENLIESFMTAFLKNRLPYEEKLAKFVLPTLGVEIPVVYNAKSSIAIVSLKKIRDRMTRDTLIQDLASTLRTEHYTGYRIPGVLYMMSGRVGRQVQLPDRRGPFNCKPNHGFRFHKNAGSRI